MRTAFKFSIKISVNNASACNAIIYSTVKSQKSNKNVLPPFQHCWQKHSAISAQIDRFCWFVSESTTGDIQLNLFLCKFARLHWVLKQIHYAAMGSTQLNFNQSPQHHTKYSILPLNALLMIKLAYLIDTRVVCSNRRKRVRHRLQRVD
jgi:hypothetical protein